MLTLHSNGQFEQSTTTEENAFIKDGELWIQPTLQDPSLMTGYHVLNLTKEGTCTGQYWYDCVATTNSTNGTVINPVKSARINTKKGVTIPYGTLPPPSPRSLYSQLTPSRPRRSNRQTPRRRLALARHLDVTRKVHVRRLARLRRNRHRGVPR